MCINAASANMGGAITYLKNVLRWIPEVAPGDRFTVIVPEKSRPVLEDILNTSDRIRLTPFPYENTGGLKRFYFDQVALPRMLPRIGADVLYSSTGFATWASPVPQVLLVRNPVYFSPEFEDVYRRTGRSLTRNRLRRRLSLISVRRSDVVLFPTRAMRSMVERYVSLEDAQTDAIHYGFDHQAISGGNGAMSGNLDRIARWKKDGMNILLNVSTYAVHKNFETLVEGLVHARDRGLRFKMLTTTSRERTADKGEYDAMQRRISEANLQDAFVELGYVPYEELSSLYRMADIFVFPSFTESFGHAMVESMAAGLPVVAADTPVNMEVCGQAATYFRTHDGEDCGRVIHTLLSDPALMLQKQELSRARAGEFSWQEYSRRLSAIFREAASGTRHTVGQQRSSSKNRDSMNQMVGTAN